MITFKASFDDGAKEDLRLAELMNKYGIQDVIFYVPAEWQTHNLTLGREPLSLKDLNYLADSFDVGSHTITHPLLTRMPLHDAKYEIVESKAMLEQLLGMGIDSFCYPRGYANPELKELVRDNYTLARNTLVGSLEEPEDPIWESTTVHAGGKRRKEYENTTWLEEGIRLLKEAITMSEQGKDPIYHIFGHSWELTRERGWDDLEILLKEIKAVA